MFSFTKNEKSVKSLKLLAKINSNSKRINMSSLSSCKGSPSHDRISLLTDDSLPRDYSLVSIASAGSQQSDEYFKSRDHAEILLRKMQNYLENDQLCDVTLIAGINGKR